jgi:asparagine synthase (glutamine-hydrolysing)
MTNEDETIWVTYNGEVYNFIALRMELLQCGHTFRSRADSEVLVHGYEEWGIEGLLARLRGMFAFALYDARGTASGQSTTRPGRLFLARDRLGIKPLYYWRSADDEQLVFASEVRALRYSGFVRNERSQDALRGFLLLGAAPSPFTCIKAVHCLPPGHYLVADATGVTLHQYWELPQGDEPSRHAGEDLSAALVSTVTQHLMSDVPLGVFLSGGLDSGSLVALASARELRDLRTLTIGFDGDQGDESREAREIAEYFHTHHTEIHLRAEDFWDTLPAVFAAMDQPTNDGINTYFVARAARQTGLTVALSGLGGDEVFWGYRHYQWLARQRGPMQLLARAPELARRFICHSACLYGRLRREERWQRFAYLKQSIAPSAYYFTVRGFFAPVQVSRLLGLNSTDDNTICDSLLEPPKNGGPNTELAVAFNRVEMQRYLHDQLLRDTDVLGMAHSIEVRVPYVDHTLVELVARIPVEQKRRPRVNKPLLVDAVHEPFVTNLSRAKKRGFSLPMDRWMRRYANELEETALRAEFLERETVRAFWRAFRQGRLHWSRAWALTVLGAIG